MQWKCSDQFRRDDFTRKPQSCLDERQESIEGHQGTVSIAKDGSQADLDSDPKGNRQDTQHVGYIAGRVRSRKGTHAIWCLGDWLYRRLLNEAKASACSTAIDPKHNSLVPAFLDTVFLVPIKSKAYTCRYPGESMLLSPILGFCGYSNKDRRVNPVQRLL